MADFRIRMKNTLAFSRCEDLSSQVRAAGEEILIVTLKDDLLTISDTGLFFFEENPQHMNFAANNRIYATKISEKKGEMLFQMLEKAPQYPDVQHFEVLEKPQSRCQLTVDKDGRRHLYAYGADDGNVPVLSPGRTNCRGWIFKADEI
jgi:hypothetical protein